MPANEHLTMRIAEAYGIRVVQLSLIRLQSGELSILPKEQTGPIMARTFTITLLIFLTGNNDMHLKNFSMILKKGKWVLASAYDLLNVAIILPARSSFEKFGKELDLNEKQVVGASNRFLKNKPKANHLIGHSFLSEAMQTQYSALLEKRYNTLYPVYKTQHLKYSYTKNMVIASIL